MEIGEGREDRLDDPADLRLDLAIDVGQLAASLQEVGVTIAIAAGQVGDLGGLGGALLTQLRAPTDVHPADWTAERAWLLLRMGEADGARMLVSGVDVRDFTPKMFQVGVQSALANADPSAMCPLEDGLDKVERQVLPRLG